MAAPRHGGLLKWTEVALTFLIGVRSMSKAQDSCGQFSDVEFDGILLRILPLVEFVQTGTASDRK